MVAKERGMVNSPPRNALKDLTCLLSHGPCVKQRANGLKEGIIMKITRDIKDNTIERKRQNIQGKMGNVGDVRCDI